MINWTRRVYGPRMTVAVGFAAALTVSISMGSWAAADAPAPASQSSVGVKTSHLEGRARMYFPAPDNDIHVTVNAHAAFDPSGASKPTRSWGTFRISHRFKMPDGTWFTNWGTSLSTA